MNNLPYLTPIEQQLMRLLWKLDTFYFKDVMKEHPDPKPHANTVSTYLKILLEKKYLTAKKDGRIFKYQVNIPMQSYRNQLLQDLLNDFYGNDMAELVKELPTDHKELALNFFSKDENPSDVSILINDLLKPGKKKKKSKEKGGKKKKQK